MSLMLLLVSMAGALMGANPVSYVRPMMGTGAMGCVVPVAAAPFGMVQLGPDTYFTSSGYHYNHKELYGFSHTHKSGGGGLRSIRSSRTITGRMTTFARELPGSGVFFVPHDGEGLINLYGGGEPFVAKLDSLFTISSEIHGDNPAPDITGLIGQYAHGNEPGHHTLYMYNYAGEPWKAQRRLSDILYTLYDTSAQGICGNDDTGQMSAWFVFSSMGFYPVTHGQGVYFIGTPLFKELSMRHANGILRVSAPNVSRENCYIQSVTLNGKPWSKSYLNHADLFGADAVLMFEMGPEPNKTWGSAVADRPESMCNAKFINR